MVTTTFTGLADPVAFSPPAQPPKLIRYSQIVKRPLDWLWPQRIAIGSVTVLGGEPGLGKGMLVADLAARVSRGSAWPGESGGHAPAGTVILLHAEDDQQDTVPERLEAAGADLDKIVTLELEMKDENSRVPRPFSLKTDLSALEAALVAMPDCRLVVIDPISAYLGSADGNHNHEIRALLQSLTELARIYRVAIVAVTHLNKRASTGSVNRVMGALSFVSTARTVWAIVRDPNDPEQRLMLPLKSNVADDNQGISFRLSKLAGAAVPRVEWAPQSLAMSFQSFCAPVSAARFNLAEQRYRDTEHHITVRLRETLSKGPKERSDLDLFLGVSEEQLYRAGDRLGVIKIKDGFWTGWIWMLPEHYPQWQIDNEQKKREQREERKRRKREKLRKAREAERQAKPEGEPDVDALRARLKARVERGELKRSQKSPDSDASCAEYVPNVKNLMAGKREFIKRFAPGVPVAQGSKQMRQALERTAGLHAAKKFLRRTKREIELALSPPQSTDAADEELRKQSRWQRFVNRLTPRKRKQVLEMMKILRARFDQEIDEDEPDVVPESPVVAAIADDTANTPPA
jgi:putative DNA primase/helicase